MLRKPAWMRTSDYAEFMAQCDPPPRCAYCDTTEELTIDHIRPRADGGTDEVSNLQILCRSHNSSKGPRPDWYWQGRFYWDGPYDPDGLWAAQRIGVHDLLRHGLNGQAAEWFSREWSQIARKLYLLAWVVGAGKTIGIPTLAFTMNALRREHNGPDCRRVDRILVLTKDRAIRDQIADDLRTDPVDFGIVSVAPRVKVLDAGWKWDKGALDEADVWVACVQMLFEENNTPREDLAQILAKFPLIVIDEPHYASAQVLGIVDAASTSLCFGLSGTPIDAAGDLLGRFVLVSLYGYQDAVANDQSLKLIKAARPVDGFILPRVPAEIFDELDITNAEILKSGLAATISDTAEVAYRIQAPPIWAVAERVVQYVVECDELPREEAFLADHRPKGTPTTLRYPVHGMIVVETIEIAKALTRHLNEWFASDRRRFPREGGFEAALVHSAVRLDGEPASSAIMLTPKHPWMLAKKTRMLTSTSARFLVAVDIGREGLNNPLCGVVGLACTAHSVVEIVQRPIGRSLRGVVTRRGSVLEQVPPARLDTIRIVSHVGFENRPAVEAGIEFVLNMNDALYGLPTLEDLIRGADPLPDIVVDADGGLGMRARIEIAGQIGEAKRIGQRIDREWMVDAYGGTLKKKRQAVQDWVDLVEREPLRAAERLHHLTDLEAETIVVREATSAVVTDADIRQHIYARHPLLVGLLARMNDLDIRLALEALVVQHQRQYRAPEMPPWTNLDTIRKDLARSVRETLGRYYTWTDERPIHQLVGHAVKIVLGVPDGESARMDGRFDIPACHLMLIRPAQAHRIEGFVRGRLIEQGACPELGAAFNIPDPYGGVETDEDDASIS